MPPWTMRGEILSYDSAVTSSGGGDATALRTSLRVALLSPLDFGVDVCLRATGVNQPFQGPLLYEQLPGSPDAGLDARKAVDGGPRPADAGSHPVDARFEAGLRDAVARDARRRDGSPSRDATIPADASADVRSDRQADATADVTVDGRVDASVDAPGHGPNDATKDVVDGAIVDASADVQTDGASVTDGGERPGGVLAWHVSSYLTVDGAGTFDVVIVPGGSPSCSNHLASQRITLDAGKFTTLVVLGSPPPARADGGADASTSIDASKDASRPDARQDAPSKDASQSDASTLFLSIIAVTDEPALSATLARARFFNATTPGDAGSVGPLRVAAVERAAIVPLAAQVVEGHVSSANPANPPVDSLGYWEGTPPLPTISLLVSAGTGAWTDAGPDGGADAATDAGAEAGASTPSWTITSASTPFDLIANTNHTGFLVGPTTTPIALVWCNDTVTPSVLTSCTKFSAQ